MPQHTQSIRSRIVGVNVPPGERLITGLAGVALAVGGLSRRSPAGLALAGVGAAGVVRAVTGHCPAYRARAIQRGIHVRRVISIQCTQREVYELWRDLSNLPMFMEHVAEITPEGEGVTRWVLTQGPMRLTFRARIVEDTPGRRLRWTSLPGGDIAHEGSLELREAPGDRGTEVEVKLHYLPPGGLAVASALHGILRRTVRTQLGVELARLRQLIETGEIATGARRRDQLSDADQGALRASDRRPPLVAPPTTAQTSAWPTAHGPAGLGGGAR